MPQEQCPFWERTHLKIKIKIKTQYLCSLTTKWNLIQRSRKIGRSGCSRFKIITISDNRTSKILKIKYSSKSFELSSKVPIVHPALLTHQIFPRKSMLLVTHRGTQTYKRTHTQTHNSWIQRESSLVLNNQPIFSGGRGEWGRGEWSGSQKIIALSIIICSFSSYKWRHYNKRHAEHLITALFVSVRAHSFVFCTHNHAHTHQKLN